MAKGVKSSWNAQFLDSLSPELHSIEIQYSYASMISLPAGWYQRHDRIHYHSENMQ